MPAFKILVESDAHGNLSWHTSVPNGATVVCTNVNRALAVVQEVLTRTPDARLLTVAEEAAIEAERVRIPDAWEATLDGFDITVTDGATAYSRSYKLVGRADVVVRGIPCGSKGEPVAGTRHALLAIPIPPAPPVAPEIPEA